MLLETKRQRLEHLKTMLKNERSTFRSHWQDLNDFILPRRGRFFVEDVNRGDRRNNKIIDSTATLAARTLRSGMMSGVTSPARPWFRLTTPNPAQAESGAVKQWLHTVSERLSYTFLKSNIYNILPIVYGDLGVFGTAAMSIEEDFDDVIRCQSFPIGSYMVAKDYRGRVNVFVREFQMTVRQVVEQFAEKDENGKIIDWSNIALTTKRLWDEKQYEQWVQVTHVIAPNHDYDGKKLKSKYKKFVSCYYENAQKGEQLDQTDLFLRESGYDYFPILAPRWETAGEDVYGTDCPGMTSLGDIKALQTMQKRKAQAIEKMVMPPMTAPASLKNQKASLLPGDVTYVDIRDGQQGFRPAHEVNLRINELAIDIQDHQQRIRRAFFEDLFLMLASSDRRDITAREIEERHEEKLLALGPVLEQLNQDLLDPLIDITFDILNRQGQIPEAPEDLQGVPLKVEYISIMAQAQKMVGISGLERTTQYVLGLAAADPSVLKKFNSQQAVDVYADMASVHPSVIRSDEDVAAMEAQEQQAMAAQQQAAMLSQGTQAAKNLSQADLEGDNALTRMIEGANAGSLVGGQ
jgi:hypothetical protein